MESQGAALPLQTGREFPRYVDKLSNRIGSTGGGAGCGRRVAGRDPAGSDGGEDRERTGRADGRSGDPGSFDSMEAFAFSGAAGAGERGIHTDDEHIGTGGADGERQPAG